jgi:hypothetical protein
MRIILSHGKVNIFNLAKNVCASVERIERFYVKHLPLSREMAKNRQATPRYAAFTDSHRHQLPAIALTVACAAKKIRL